MCVQKWDQRRKNIPRYHPAITTVLKLSRHAGLTVKVKIQMLGKDNAKTSPSPDQRILLYESVSCSSNSISSLFTSE